MVLDFGRATIRIIELAHEALRAMRSNDKDGAGNYLKTIVIEIEKLATKHDLKVR